MSAGRSTPSGPVGVLGGTFDPIHLGHLLLAEQARDLLALARVLFVPAPRPPHKAVDDLTPAERRASMVALAIADDPQYELCRIELDRPGPSYTVDTLECLRDDLESDLVLILSAESFRTLSTWREPRRILEAARLAVLPRGGHLAPDAAWLGPDLADLAGRVTILDTPRIELSGHDLRTRVAAGHSIRHLVPRAVEAYIDDHSLYRDRGGSRTDPPERTPDS